MQEARAAPFAFLSPAGSSARGKQRSHQVIPCSRKPLDFSPWQGTASSSSVASCSRAFPSNGPALRGPGSSDSPGPELGQEATRLVPAPGSRWLQPGHAGSCGGLCACHGTGTRSQGRASPAPGNFSLSSWMSALAVIKIKSIFFCCKKKKETLFWRALSPSQLLCLCDGQGEANGILGLQGTSGALLHSGRRLDLNFQIVFSFLY